MKGRLEQILAPLKDEFEIPGISSSMSVEALRRTLLEKLNQNHKNRALSSSIHATLLKLANEFPLNEECIITRELINFNAEPPTHVCLSTGEAYDKEALKEWFYQKLAYISPLTNRPISRLDKSYLLICHKFDDLTIKLKIPSSSLYPLERSQLASPSGSEQRRMLIHKIASILREFNHNNTIEIDFTKIVEEIVSKLIPEDQEDNETEGSYFSRISALASSLYTALKARFFNSVSALVFYVCPDYLVKMELTELHITMTISQMTDMKYEAYLRHVSNGESGLFFFHQVINISNDSPAPAVNENATALNSNSTLHETRESTPLVRFSQGSDTPVTNDSQNVRRNSFGLGGSS